MKDLDKLFTSLVKTYGENGVYHSDEIPQYGVVSTGSLSLDFALGIGGLPMGKITEIVGPNGAGKTLLCLHIIENFLKQYPDKIVAFIDVEQRFEKDWAKNFVTDMDRVLVLKPGSGEEGINMLRDLAESDMMSLCIWDSIGGTPTAAALIKDAHKQQFGGNSKVITTLSQFATTLAGKHDFAFVATNQIRQDISGYQQLVSPGGEAWKHACTVRIYVRPAPKSKDGEYYETINGEERLVGRKIIAKIVKSSVGDAGRVANYWFYNVPNSKGFGIDKVEEVVRLSVLTGVVERSGGWHKHNLFPDGKILGQVKVSEFLKDRPDVADVLFELTMAVMKSGEVDMSEIVPFEDPELSHEGEEANLAIKDLTLQEIAKKARA